MSDSTSSSTASESSSSSSSSSSSLLDDLECPLCYTLFFDPITLQCGHTFCRSCLAQSFSSHRSECCICRAPSHIDVFSQPPSLSLTLRLHLFEPRYRILIHRALATHRKFFCVWLGQFEQKNEERPAENPNSSASASSTPQVPSASSSSASAATAAAAAGSIAALPNAAVAQIPVPDPDPAARVLPQPPSPHQRQHQPQPAPPGQPLQLVGAAIANQITDYSALEGAYGSLCRISHCRSTPDGRFYVESVCLTRVRLCAIEEEEAGFGLLSAEYEEMIDAKEEDERKVEEKTGNEMKERNLAANDAQPAEEEEKKTRRKAETDVELEAETLREHDRTLGSHLRNRFESKNSQHPSAGAPSAGDSNLSAASASASLARSSVGAGSVIDGAVASDPLEYSEAHPLLSADERSLHDLRGLLLEQLRDFPRGLANLEASFGSLPSVHSSSEFLWWICRALAHHSTPQLQSQLFRSLSKRERIALCRQLIQHAGRAGHVQKTQQSVLALILVLLFVLVFLQKNYRIFDSISSYLH